MKKRTIRHSVSSLIVLLLFGIFAVCVLAVLLVGANAYRGLTERDQAAYDRRTGVQYVATRVRQADSADAVSVEEFGGVDCLVLRETLDGAEYLTRVYCYEGCIRELYTAAQSDMSPEAGETVMEAESLSLSLEDGLLAVTVVDMRGTPSSLYLSLRGGEGGAV